MSLHMSGLFSLNFVSVSNSCFFNGLLVNWYEVAKVVQTPVFPVLMHSCDPQQSQGVGKSTALPQFSPFLACIDLCVFSRFCFLLMAELPIYHPLHTHTQHTHTHSHVWKLCLQNIKDGGSDEDPVPVPSSSDFFLKHFITVGVLHLFPWWSDASWTYWTANWMRMGTVICNGSPFAPRHTWHMEGWGRQLPRCPRGSSPPGIHALLCDVPLHTE